MFCCHQHQSEAKSICRSRMCNVNPIICHKMQCRKIHSHFGNSKVEDVKYEQFQNMLKQKNHELARSDFKFIEELKKYSGNFIQKVDKLKKILELESKQLESYQNSLNQQNQWLHKIINNNYHEVQGKHIHQFIQLDLKKHIQSKERSLHLRFNQFQKKFTFVEAEIDGILNLLDVQKLQKENKERMKAKQKINRDQLEVVFKMHTLMMNKELDLCSRFKSTYLRLIQFIPQIHSLKKLDLGQNSIREIKIGFQLPKLKELILMKNSLTTIDFLSNSDFSGLEYLDLKQNELKNIEAITRLNAKNLSKLNLYDNKIECIEPLTRTIFHKLICLNLHKNYINNIIPLPKLNCQSMAQLYLNQNQISDIEPLTQIAFQKLQTLNLSDNLISKLETFTKIKFHYGLKLSLINNPFRDYNFNEYKVFLQNRCSLKLTI